jgi:hypothetical protein
MQVDDITHDSEQANLTDDSSHSNGKCDAIFISPKNFFFSLVL